MNEEKTEWDAMRRQRKQRMEGDELELTQELKWSNKQQYFVLT